MLAWLLAGALLYLTARRFAHQSRSREVLAGTVIAIAFLVSVITLAFLGWLPGEEKLGWIEQIKASLRAWVPNPGIDLPLPNSAATFLEGLVFYALLAAVSAASRRRRILSGAASAVIGLALLLSGSRGAWAAVGAGLLIWLILEWKPGPGMRIAGLALLFTPTVILILMVWFMLTGHEVLNTLLPGVLNRPDRLEVFQNSLYLARSFVFSGIGLGDTFGILYSRFELLIPYVFLTYPHQLWLGVWLYTGLAGYVTFWGWVSSHGLCVWKGNSPGTSIWGRAALLGLLAMLTHGLSDARMLVDGWCWLPLFLNLGLVTVSFAPQDGTRPTFSRLLPAGLSILTGIGMAFSAGNPVSAWWINRAMNLVAGAEPQGPVLMCGDKLTISRAREYFGRAAMVAPNDPSPHLRLGVMDMEAGLFQQALRHAQFSYQADPRRYAARRLLGFVLALNQQPRAAYDLLRDTHDITNNVQGLAGYYEEIGQNRPAVDLYLLLRQWGENDAIDERIRQLEDTREEP